MKSKSSGCRLISIQQRLMGSTVIRVLPLAMLSCLTFNNGYAVTQVSTDASQIVNRVSSTNFDTSNTQNNYADQDTVPEQDYLDEDVNDNGLDDGFNKNDTNHGDIQTTEVVNADPSQSPRQLTSVLNSSSNMDVSNHGSMQTDIEDVPLNVVSPDTLRTFVQVIDLVRNDYVEPVSDEVLFNDAIYGMLEKLDSHAEFLEGDAYDNLRAFTEGDVGHVGLQVNFDPTSSEWVIEEISLGSPAQQADLQVGDYVHQINNTKLTAGMRDTDIIQMLSGIAGTQVDLVVSQEGRLKHSVTLQRNVAQKQQITIETYDDLAYIRLPAFQNDTALQITQGLQQIDTPISGIVIDVRNNPGGVLKSAIDVASLFMENTDVVQVKGRKRPLTTLSTQGLPILKDLPVVLIQNRYSASASEVLASSLQVNKRATIVGERSYGKGSVQAIRPLNNDQAIKLTVAHYYAANGTEIEGRGVTPDIVFLEENGALWQQRALSILREQDRPLGIIFQASEGDLPVENDY